MCFNVLYFQNFCTEFSDKLLICRNTIQQCHHSSLGILSCGLCINKLSHEVCKILVTNELNILLKITCIWCVPNTNCGIHTTNTKFSVDKIFAMFSCLGKECSSFFLIIKYGITKLVLIINIIPGFAKS